MKIKLHKEKILLTGNGRVADDIGDFIFSKY